VKHCLGLVQMLAPGAVDFGCGMSIIPFGIRTELCPGEDSRDTLQKRTIGLGHFKNSLH
jgi:hypothetical protein